MLKVTLTLSFDGEDECKDSQLINSMRDVLSMAGISLDSVETIEKMEECI